MSQASHLSRTRVVGSNKVVIDVDNNGIVAAVWYDNQMIPFEVNEIVPSVAGVHLRKQMNLPDLVAMELIRR